MEKRKDKSYWIILILLLILLVSSILLYQNINKGATGNDNTVIGTLTFKNHTIERKYDSDVIWEKIESGLVLRNKDTIRSGDFSDAVLTLQDKTKININENSMIYLDISEGDINLNFAYGSMSLVKRDDGTATTVKIKSGQNTVEIKNSDIILEKKGKEELAFQVKQGTAKIKNGNQEKELKANESVKLKDSEIQVSEINLNPLSPPDASIVSEKSEVIPVNFSWTAKNANKLKLEIAFDSRFQSIYKIFNVGNDSFAANLGQGNYYWRISSEKSKNKKKSVREFSPFRKLTVYTNLPPTLLSPQKNQIFSYNSITPIIPFTWKRLETAKNYQLEISRNSNFTEIVKSISTSQTSLGIDKLEPGKYFARLSADPIREDLKIEKSQSISFSIEKKTELAPPSLVSPVNEQEISSLIFANSGFLFQVKDSPELNNYTFQISTTPKFSKLILERESNSNQIKLNSKLDTREYYWRVQGTTSDGKKTSFSETGRFLIKENQVVELLSPQNNSVLNIKENPISFRWKRLPYKTNFLLEISDSSEFSKKTHSVKTEEYSQSIPFPKEGKFYWRIISLGDDQSVIAKSAISSFQVEEMHELIPTYPSRNEIVDMSPIDSLVFRWEKNSRVANYHVEFYRVKSGSKILLANTKTKHASFVFRNLSKLDEGSFIWTLQESIDINGQSQLGKKVSVPFKIYLSEKPGNPDIVTPPKMYVE